MIFPLDGMPSEMHAAVMPAQSASVQRAEALAADLRYLFRKHKARIVWREELDGRVTVGLTIEDATWPKKLVQALGPKWVANAIWAGIAVVFLGLALGWLANFKF